MYQMKFIDILTSNECRILFDGVERFVSTLLFNYNERLKQDIQANNFNYQPKDIFDSVWGTIELNGLEICLIDSPLIQRLRNIKQLGCTSYVYCHADYSRFAHTIGVTEVAGRISHVLTRELIRKRHRNADFCQDFEKIVRIAAIFHDSGHMFFSHVAEKYLMEQDSVFNKELGLVAANNYFNLNINSKASFHEFIGVMIVNSKEVRRFLSLIFPHFGFKSGITEEKLIEYISSLIVGVPVDKLMLPYYQVIKGIIDADRMDYLTRDSFVTKVPIAVDIARLINKMTVIEIDPNYEQSAVWDSIHGENETYSVLGVQYSARSLVSQFSVARTVLYQSIYCHHKKCTAEAMLRKACHDVFALIPKEKYRLDYILSLNDNAIGEYCKDIIIPSNKIEEYNASQAKDIILRLRDRNLFKRVLCISRDVMANPDKFSYSKFIKQIILSPYSTNYSNFITALKNEYNQVLNLLGKRRVDNPTFIFTEANWISGEELDIPIQHGESSYRFATELYKQVPAFGEQNIQKQYYLVTDQEDRIAVYLALQLILRRDYSLQVCEDATNCGKFTENEIDKFQIKLLEQNYYDGRLYLIPDRIIRKFINKTLYRQVLNKYSDFSGPEGAKFDDNRLFSFIKQFLYSGINYSEIQNFISEFLAMLNNGIYINRTLFADSFKKLVNELSANYKKKLYFCKLGGAKDSGNHFTYFLNEVKGINIIESLDRLSAKDIKEGIVVFYDDGLYSGTQVISIFQEYLGVSQELRMTQEKHVDELSDEMKLALCSSTVILAYVCVNKHSIEKVVSNVKKLGINNFEIIYKVDLSDKFFKKITEGKRKLKEILQDIGTQLMLSKKTKDGFPNTGWTIERINEAALGYNDAQQIVLTYFNVPTYTITALWQDGQYKENAWFPLFPRTTKE